MSSSYRDIIKSSGLIAFVQLFQMGFSLIRNKAIALILGAGGFGIWSLYYTFIQMISSFSLLGMDQSGVRDIARHNTDRETIGKCIWTFRRAIFCISVLVGIAVFCFASRISDYLFNSDQYAGGIRLFSLVVIGEGIARGGYAILNGIRDMKKLAKSQILSSILGSLSAIGIIFFWKEQGIALGLSTITFILAIITSWFVKKTGVKEVVPSQKEASRILRSLLVVGVGFTLAGLIATLMTLFAKSYLNQHYNLTAVGIYQASWTISNLYIGIILSAMGIDFMPRLSQVADNNAQMCRLLNEQIEFGVLLSSVGVTGILIFSSFILQLLYSSEFISGVNIIRWQVLGVAMRIIAFPFSYAIMAKGKSLLYVIIQALFWVSDYLLLIVFSSWFGFEGLGVNYFIAYTGYLLMTYIASSYLCHFRFNRKVIRIIAVTWGCIIIIWLFNNYAPKSITYVAGIPFLVIQGLAVNWYMKKYMKIDLIRFIQNKLRK